MDIICCFFKVKNLKHLLLLFYMYIYMYNYYCQTSTATQLIISSSVGAPGLLRGVVHSASLDGLQNEQMVDSSYGPLQSPITGI